ncbi:MAG: AI-2E family transporter [Spirochaetes bacterium]|nr:AI-2E family transporter [Spirochaetota bacterium]
MEKNNRFRLNRAIFSLLIFICCLFVGALLVVASSVILPFTIAVLLTFVMYPMVRWLDKKRVHRFLSIFLVVSILVAALFLFGFILFTSGSNIVAAYPRYEYRIVEIYLWVAQFFDLSFDESLTIWENLWGQLGVRNFIRDFAVSFSTISINFISSAVLVILFIVFILLEVSFFKEKLEAAFAKRSDNIQQIAYDSMVQVSRYLTAKFFISLVTGLIIGVGLSIIGLEFAVLWGVLQFFLNFIPMLGSIAAGVGMTSLALVQFWPDPLPVVWVVILILATNTVIGSFLDPRIVGNHVGISPLMVLVSLSIWGWIWGFVGMILAVPMVVIIKIVCENVPILKPVSILLGTQKNVEAKKAERQEGSG